MPLTPEEIKALLAIPQRGKGKGKNFIDTSVRDIQTWFKLAHKMLDEETNELAQCSNPDCADNRPVKMIAEVNEKKVCRRCFLLGYGSETV